jgi:hypothetical protein
MRRVKNTSNRRTAARMELARGGDPWQHYDLADLTDLQNKLIKHIDSETKSRFIVQLDSKLVAVLDASIADLEKKVDLLSEIAYLAPVLDEALTRLTNERPSELPPLRAPEPGQKEPAVVRSSRALLTGSPLKDRELAERRDEIEKAITAVESLGVREQQLSDLWRIAEKLKGKVPDADKTKLEQSEHALIGIRAGLWMARTTDDVTALDDELSKTGDQIRPLLGALDDELFALSFSSVEDLRFRRLVASVDRQFDVLPISGLDRQYARMPESVDRLETWRRADEVIRGSMWRRGVVVAVATGTAIVTGLAALYVGKTWGTPWDYVLAVAWGLGVQVTVTAIAAAANGFGPIGSLRQAFGIGPRPKDASSTSAGGGS